MSKPNTFPTMLDIMEEVRSILGDVQAPGGKLYSRDVLTRPVQAAVRATFRLLLHSGDPAIVKTQYVRLPAQQSVIYPHAAGLLDCAYPLEVWERANVNFYVVSSAARSGAQDLEVTLTIGHGKPINSHQQVTVTNIAGFPSAYGMFNARVTANNIFMVLGCYTQSHEIFDGSVSAQNLLAYGDDQFIPTNLVRDRFNYLRPVMPLGNTQVRLTQVTYNGQALHIDPSTLERQLRIRYRSTAVVPELDDDIVMLPDCLDFIATLAAANVTLSRNPTRYQQLSQRVWGRGSEGSKMDGLAYQLAQSAIRYDQALRGSDNTRPGQGEWQLPVFMY